MVHLSALVLPIVLSTLFVFIASSVIHMLLPYHRTNYHQLPDEDKVLGVLRGLNLRPAIYTFPYCTHQTMKSPEVVEKFKQGPVGFMSVMPSGAPKMGKFMGLWTLFCLLVSIFAAYLACHTIASGAPYRRVFRIVGTAAFMGYGFGPMVNSIWKAQPWKMTFMEMFDGLIYACLTAGTFGWLWPR
jgi:hypothetical protein